jgi:hypothetical protein
MGLTYFFFNALPTNLPPFALINIIMKYQIVNLCITEKISSAQKLHFEPTRIEKTTLAGIAASISV